MQYIHDGMIFDTNKSTKVGVVVNPLNFPVNRTKSRKSEDFNLYVTENGRFFLGRIFSVYNKGVVDVAVSQSINAPKGLRDRFVNFILLSNEDAKFYVEKMNNVEVYKKYFGELIDG